MAWIQAMVNNFTMPDGTNFRAWLPGEMPKTFAMQIYLQADHDGLSKEQIETLLKRLNAPLPVDFKISSIVAQTDKQGAPKGRVVHVSAGATFYNHCKERGFELLFAGGNVPCITVEDKQKKLIVSKKRPNEGQNGNSKENGGRKGPNPKDGSKKHKDGNAKN
jgi:hypothetical protein